MRKFLWAAVATVCVGSVLGFAAPAAHANLIDEGVTYSLTAKALNSTTDEFTLTITGINGATDTKKNRWGFDAIAFGQPADFVSATAVTSGFTEQLGGLSNSGGCNGNGNFFCFSGFLGNDTGPALGANSSLTFVFDVTLSAGGSFAGYDPSMKIDWIGTGVNNYDLVSKSLGATYVAVPGPLVGAGLPGLIAACAGLVVFSRRRRHRFG